MTKYFTHSYRSALLQATGFMLPAVAGVLLALWMPHVPPPGLDLVLHSISPGETAELEALFEELNYEWPPRAEAGAIPAIAVRAVPTDLHTLSVERRKAIFFRILAPLVAAENRKLKEQRAFLMETFARFPALPETGSIATRVRSIASRFNIAGDLDQEAVRQSLLRRVDSVPTALVLAQAANESGWGTSRFAKEANNLFGMWTWKETAGLAPRQRAKDASHFIRVFDDLHAAVSNYLHTINVGPAYRDLRELRVASRNSNTEPDALVLAGGLRRYSKRGDEYVREIRDIIRYNRLHELPPLSVDTMGGHDNL